MSHITKRHQPCPSCPSSDGYCEYDDGHGFCYSCKQYFKEGIVKVSDEYTYEYLPWRGIDRRTMEFYDVKTKIDAEGKPISLGYVYPNDSVKVRFLDRKDFYSVGEIGKAGLFGRNKFGAGSHKYVTITEGEADALSLYQVLHAPVVSVQSATTAARDAALDRSWLNSFERVYLAFDNDLAGRDSAKAVARLLDYSKVYSVTFTNRKDANEYLQNGESDELLNIWTNAKKFLPDEIKSSLAEFKTILSEPVRWGVPYPFKTLTDMTYGIRLGESVLLTAQEGVGKTELMHAIEHNILMETDDAVGAFFLEEPAKRHLQTLAGITLRKPAHLPDSGLSQPEIISALEKVVATDDRLHLYSHFGSDDPTILLDAIRFLVTARACSYILLDHITMAISGLDSDDERRSLDILSTKLEMMVKELNFSLIMVSHVNDDGKTRGSRYISKVADIRIDAWRDITHVDPLERNTTYLTVSKNRYCGRTGPAGKLVFDLASCTYQEDFGY